MDSSMPLPNKVVYEFPSLFRVYQDGSIDRLIGTTIVPPSLDHPLTKSKDVVFSPQSNLSSRLYIPKSLPSDRKIPLLLYFHGGGFVVETAFSPSYHNYLNKLAAEANVVIVSVDYRRAPEHPLPTAFDDAWAALKWVASHSNVDGPEEWINLHADLRRVFAAGDSAGGNIAHNLAMRFEGEKLDGVSIAGIAPVHPFFWGEGPVDGETEDPEMRPLIDGLWNLVYPNSSGLDDPVINPGLDPNLDKLCCSKVFVVVAEKDPLARRGWLYYEKLKKSGWKGNLEILESKDEDHVFHIFFKPSCDNAVALMEKFVSFLNQDH